MFIIIRKKHMLESASSMSNHILSNPTNPTNQFQPKKTSLHKASHTKIMARFGYVARSLASRPVGFWGAQISLTSLEDSGKVSVPPRKLTECPPKKGPFHKKSHVSNHGFSGYMLFSSWESQFWPVCVNNFLHVLFAVFGAVVMYIWATCNETEDLPCFTFEHVMEAKLPCQYRGWCIRLPPKSHEL